MMPLTREDAVERLTASEREIRALGVERLALFGSVLQGEAHPDSDVDVLIQFSPGAKTFDRFIALFDLEHPGRLRQQSNGRPPSEQHRPGVSPQRVPRREQRRQRELRIHHQQVGAFRRVEADLRQSEYAGTLVSDGHLCDQGSARATSSPGTPFHPTATTTYCFPLTM